MDKCTNEQFWMVVAMTGVNGLVITNPIEIQNMGVNRIIIIVALALAAIGALAYVISRHWMFFKLREAQLDLIDKDEELSAYFEKKAKEDARQGRKRAGRPDFLKPNSRRSTWFATTGIGMYSAWIAVGTFAAAWSVAVQAAVDAAGG